MRKVISKVILQVESNWINQFVLSHVSSSDGDLQMWEIFDKYKQYLKKSGNETELSIDGFGRLFPKCFERRMILKNGKQLNGVVGVRVV